VRAPKRRVAILLQHICALVVLILPPRLVVLFSLVYAYSCLQWRKKWDFKGRWNLPFGKKEHRRFKEM